MENTAYKELALLKICKQLHKPRISGLLFSTLLLLDILKHFTGTSAGVCKQRNIPQVALSSNRVQTQSRGCGVNNQISVHICSSLDSADVTQSINVNTTNRL